MDEIPPGCTSISSSADIPPASLNREDLQRRIDDPREQLRSQARQRAHSQGSFNPQQSPRAPAGAARTGSYFPPAPPQQLQQQTLASLPLPQPVSPQSQRQISLAVARNGFMQPATRDAGPTTTTASQPPPITPQHPPSPSGSSAGTVITIKSDSDPESPDDPPRDPLPPEEKKQMDNPFLLQGVFPLRRLYPYGRLLERSKNARICTRDRLKHFNFPSPKARPSPLPPCSVAKVSPSAVPGGSGLHSPAPPLRPPNLTERDGREVMQGTGTEVEGDGREVMQGTGTEVERGGKKGVLQKESDGQEITGGWRSKKAKTTSERDEHEDYTGSQARLPQGQLHQVLEVHFMQREN
uniref:Uncharacterized protein n=1 Tax=Chromera velia CCMP2878 TaxID=1169474 RepID=A0A0G4HVQ7_9ALVE|eukprot:Cvel_8897.t1-p1 / transcript=Cvel_8897.t1 / gene=Cvel_8897 / organism=Chromera_velia_CCMP2878 / gene_product=hypothetical protein / transcript_product=hypothetical protein / location=Cvel_scaffold501:1379-3802(-) / protein_length=352 / sequence_SO=supercontig / SO=protein_coding / is_pseudo=false